MLPQARGGGNRGTPGVDTARKDRKATAPAVAELTPQSRGFEQFARVLESVYHREVAPIEAEMNRSEVTVPALFSDGQLIAFVVLQTYRFPQDSIGNEFREETLSEIPATEGLEIFLVRLIHGDAEKAYHLKEPLSLLFGHVERKLGRQGRDCCFLVSAYREREPKSRRLYESLGFREEGAPSYCLEMDPRNARVESARGERVLPGIRIDFLSESPVVPAESWAAAYNRVFCGGADVVTADHVAGLLSRPDVSRELSVLVSDERRKRVGGFLLTDRIDSRMVRIVVAGLVDELRGRGIVGQVWPRVLRRCREAGVERLQFVTGKRAVRALATRRLGATEKDRLVWMLKCSRT